MSMLTGAAKNLMLDALDASLPTGIGMLSLHSAYSSVGAHELVGGTPAYARQPVTWYPAFAGLKTLISGVTFDVPAGVVAWVGYWSTEPTPTFLGMAPAGGGIAFPFLVAAVPTTIVQCVNHQLIYGMSVAIWGGLTSNLPSAGGTDLGVGTQYFVAAVPSPDSVTLSTALGGSPLTFVTSGSGFLQQWAPSVYSGQGQYTVTIFGLDSRVI